MLWLQMRLYCLETNEQLEDVLSDVTTDVREKPKKLK